ncbi:compound eye opsin BCRH2 [Lepeophtheirus salmonis]|uniref:compound eye opsin BCRH2 n=1 Tax=Lepeophtheirus salmonis TaxID=72036 RepID=UPI001AEB7258|nr:compound eye opsin BCRH2-like [Lepeophtheirus salmonis]
MSALKGLSSPSAGLYMDDVYYNQYPPGMKMTDGIPEELREVIHSHWDQFSPANPLIAHFFGVMFFFLWVMNFVGNGLVIFIFSKVKSLRTPSNMFVINLALSDLLMMTTMGPAVTVNVFMQRYWAWGVFGCKLYGCIGAICGVVSILTMVVIGYDRYNVIVKGLNGFRISVGKALAIILVIWAYSIAISALALFDIWGGYTVEGLLFTCSYDYLTDDANNTTYILFTFFFMYVLPMSLVFFFYSSIVKAVWAHEMALKQQAKKMNVESLRTNVDSNAESAEIRIAKVAVTNVSLWAGIWTPYTLVVLMAVMGSRSSITPLVSQLPSFIAKTASCLNPMVYAMSHPKYREALMKEVPCLGIEEESMEEAVTTKEPVKA